MPHQACSVLAKLSAEYSIAKSEKEKAVWRTEISVLFRVFQFTVFLQGKVKPSHLQVGSPHLSAVYLQFQQGPTICNPPCKRELTLPLRRNLNLHLKFEFKLPSGSLNITIKFLIIFKRRSALFDPIHSTSATVKEPQH